MRKIDLFPDIRQCARCGRDHAALPFLRLQRPMEDADGVDWTHWATCPTTGEPVLMFIRTTEEQADADP